MEGILVSCQIIPYPFCDGLLPGKKYGDFCYRIPVTASSALGYTSCWTEANRICVSKVEKVCVLQNISRIRKFPLRMKWRPQRFGSLKAFCCMGFEKSCPLPHCDATDTRRCLGIKSSGGLTIGGMREGLWSAKHWMVLLRLSLRLHRG